MYVTLGMFLARVGVLVDGVLYVTGVLAGKMLRALLQSLI